MFLDLSDDQIALRDGIASLLAGRFGPDRIRAGFDRAMFDELAEAGVFSLISDGFSWADAVIVFEQLGEFCVPGPLVGSLLAGGKNITAVYAETTRTIEFLDNLEALIILDEDDVRSVDLQSVVAEALDWPLDPLTPVSLVSDFGATTTITGIDPVEWRQRGAVLTAAYCLGLASRLCDMSVAYAKERLQFDRPIGSFQAIKHLLADMAVRTEVARAAVYNAGAHLDAPSIGGLSRSVSVAKALGSEAAIRCGKDATQVHGGMGYTWEVDVHLYLKRAWVLDTHFGSHEHHFDHVAETA